MMHVQTKSYRLDLTATYGNRPARQLRWRPERCKPLTAVYWLLGALALTPIWLWLVTKFVE